LSAVAASRTYLIAIMRLPLALRFSGTVKEPLNASTLCLLRVSNTNFSSPAAAAGCPRPQAGNAAMSNINSTVVVAVFKSILPRDRSSVHQMALMLTIAEGFECRSRCAIQSGHSVPCPTIMVIRRGIFLVTISNQDGDLYDRNLAILRRG